MKRTLILLLLSITAISVILYFQSKNEPKSPQKADNSLIQSKSAVEGPLQVIDLKIGNGKSAEKGDTITVNYIGSFPDNKKFDSSYDRGEPFQLVLGAGRVIKGWDLGLVGMKVGGKRKLIIPPELGYGKDGMSGVIPGNAILIFEIELLDIKKQ